MKTLNLVSFQKRQNISGKPIFICVVVRCQLCRKLSLFHVALQISTHAFVLESIKNGSFVFADERQYSDISINMSLFASITMISWLSNTRVECVCCSWSQPHAFSWLYYVIYAEECERVAQSLHRNEMPGVRPSLNIAFYISRIKYYFKSTRMNKLKCRIFLPNKIAECDIICE